MIQTTVEVGGMACSMCEAHINDTVRNAFPVDKVSSSHAKGKTVILSKEPLDEIILKINEKFKGEFTNADRVLLTALHDRLLADQKLAKLARSSDPQIFTESIFPKAFDTAAQDSYLEAQDTFSSLFEDTSKYKAIMSALAEWLYGEFRKK